MKLFFKNTIAVFFVLAFLFIPLTFNGKDEQFQITHFLFSKPIAFFKKIFFPNALEVNDFSSDTIALNLLLLLLFFIALTSVFLLRILKIKAIKISTISRTIACYYLAFVLLKYGFDKVFKTQFYLPEPNILFTPYGDLSKDILYWSTIGTSRFYSIAIGSIELITAILILIKRTRVLGLLLAIGVFINVIIVNFGFDISVKTFALFLLSTTIFAVFPELKKLIDFFVFHKSVQLLPTNEIFSMSPHVKIGLKVFVIGLLFLQIVFPYIQSQNFNDDNQKRPFLHGVYQVNQMIHKNDSLKKCNFPIKNIFIHRNNYLIFQDNNNKMTDFYFEIDTLKKQFILQDYHQNKTIANYDFIKKDSTFKLQFKKYIIISKAINWRKCAALQNQMHFTIDKIQ